jgi:hypothetical protein
MEGKSQGYKFILNKFLIPPLPSTFAVPLLIDTNWDLSIIAIFAFSIVLFNLRKTKKGRFLSFLMSTAICYAVFFLSIAIMGLINFIFFMDMDINSKGLDTVFGISTADLQFGIIFSLISPVLMFLAYSILFVFPKSIYVRTVIGISILVLLLGAVIMYSLQTNFSFLLWQTVMILALQLILYKKEVLQFYFNIR